MLLTPDYSDHNYILLTQTKKTLIYHFIISNLVTVTRILWPNSGHISGVTYTLHL